MTDYDDRGLHELLAHDPQQGWRAFVEQYTPPLLAIIGQAGLRSRDEVMERRGEWHDAVRRALV